MPANINLNTREQYVLFVPGDPKSSETGGKGHLSVDLIILRKVIVVSEPRNVRRTRFSHKFKKTCGIEF